MISLDIGTGENGSVNLNVQLRAIKRDTLPMPGHRVGRGRALSGTKHSGAAILISANTQLAHKMGQGFAALDAALSHYRTGNSIDGSTMDMWQVSTHMLLAHVPPRDGTLTELANFDNDERNVIHERAVTPRSHPVKDCLPHFRQFMFCRIEN